MKQRINLYYAATTLMVLVFAAGNLQAQVTQTVTVTATALVQNQNETDNGTTTTIPAPTKKSITTKTLLQMLATDENTAGNYPSTTFPSGAKLVVADGVFQVVAKNGILLVDVSDILSVESGDTIVYSEKYSDENGEETPPYTETDYSLTTVTYDATIGGGTTSFTLTGLGVWTTTDTNPNSTSGIYKETISGSIKSGSGQGFAPDGSAMVITGTVSAKGSANLEY